MLVEQINSMEVNAMRCVRIWFTKLGAVKYISHLDLMRSMTRTIRRSKIPLWYTEGFNPHPYMTFSLPLSLGMESKCESMDIKIEGEITNEEIFEKLSTVMPAAIEVLKVTDPVSNPKKIAFGKFDIFFDVDKKNQQDFMPKLKDLMSQEEIVVQKLGKKGKRKILKDVNLSEFLQSYSISSFDDLVKLTVVFPAGSTTNINPALLADEIVKQNGAELTYSIIRRSLMLEDMSEFE